MPPSDDTMREIAKALRHHVDAATLEKIVNELFDVPGNRDFREDIEELARRVDAALRLIADSESPLATGALFFYGPCS